MRYQRICKIQHIASDVGFLIKEFYIIDYKSSRPQRVAENLPKEAATAIRRENLKFKGIDETLCKGNLTIHSYTYAE